MHDHFLQLGVDPEASAADIEAALAAKPELEAAGQILLNERRRAPYQRTVLTLRSIGMLRHRLGLDNEDTWFVQTCPDFAPRLHSRKYAAEPAATPAGASASVQADTSDQAANAASRSPSGPASRAWLKPVVILLVLAAIAAGIAAVL